MINVLLVDDHKMIRDGVRSMLSQMENIDVVGECGDGNEALTFLNAKKDVDIIMMDINMPNLNGIDATKELRKKNTKAKVIAMTMRGGHIYISKMLKAGASGYILKDSGKDELLTAILEVYNGKNYFSHEIRNNVMSAFMHDKKIINKDGFEMEEFSKREWEVLDCISIGLTNKEAGEKLFISHRTVETHRRNLLQKTGVNNTAELVRFGIENGFIECDIVTQ